MKINKKELMNSDLVEATFNFWFTDRDHIRSPFPHYIQERLKTEATAIFFEWVEGLDEKAEEEVNDELIGEKFEEIIFENAMKLVLTDDEKITIQYPFLPRVSDEIFRDEQSKNGDSIIIDRMIVKEGDHSFLRVILSEKKHT